LAYLSAIIYDLILIPMMIQHTGEYSSSFYLMYYLTISVAASVLSFWFATTIALIATASYVISIFTDMGFYGLFDICMRLGFIWAYFLAIAYASEHLRRSEKRLLKLFDTLNLRTSELEKSQSQLQTIYENSRILASLLDAESVVREVMNIMGEILGYHSFAIIFKDKSGKLYFRARSSDGATSFHPRPCPSEGQELIRKVIDLGEPACLKNIISRFDYKPLSNNSRSLMLVPLASHGIAMGLLVAESSDEARFSDKDIQMLSIVARSAALALENAELHRRTEELTINDELTETFNYRYFVQKLQEEKRRAARYNLPLSLIMVDIDWFKKLNDSYGHEIGNVVLKYLSEIIKRCIRDVDVFCRYGGEEFVIILPQTPQVEATQIAERIRQQIEKAVIDVGKAGKLKVTVSVGVTSFPENGKSQDELLAVADQALYRAKGEGRNLVCII
jgi:diguanylate cyclase (GGDEF)-like protein